MSRGIHDCDRQGHVYYTTLGGNSVCQYCGHTGVERPDPSVNMVGKVGATHPDTSVEAAHRIEPRSGTQRQYVLAELSTSYPGGMTDEELQGELEMNPASQRPRRGELVEQGWIEDSGQRRKTASGMDAIVWRYKL